MYAPFDDFLKAFARVCSSMYSLALECHQCLTALKKLHTNMEGHVAYGGELSSKFPIHTGVRQGLVEGPGLFILFLAAMIEVTFPEDFRFHREMGVKLELAKGDITNVRSFQRATIIRILDCFYAVDTTLVSRQL